MRVFVLDKNLNPLGPCHQAQAGEILQKGRAKVYRRFPFTIVWQDRTIEASATHSHRIKIDPGSESWLWLDFNRGGNSPPANYRRV